MVFYLNEAEFTRADRVSLKNRVNYLTVVFPTNKLLFTKEGAECRKPSSLTYKGVFMKKKLKCLGIAALIAISIFSIVACGDSANDDSAVLTGTVTLDNTSPRVGDTITATYNPGNGSGTPTWTWLANNSAISGANSNTYNATAADTGKQLKARVSYADQSGSVTSNATNAVASAVAPNLTGTVTLNNNSPKAGDTITAAYSSGNGTGTATWQWLRDETVITGANSNTYNVVSDDLGMALKARVSYANQSGAVESATTAAVVPAELTGTVTLDNMSPKVGDTLTASYNPGNGTGTATWQWLRDTTVITGANSSTYTVVSDDLGKTLKAKVSYADQSGYRESAATAAVTVTVTAHFNISFDAIVDTAPLILDQTISLTGSNTTVTLTVDNSAGLYSGIAWYVTGTDVSGSGAEFTLNSANPAYNRVGDHFLTLELQSGGIPYSKTIIFTVTP
jgi:hypothetical protein